MSYDLSSARQRQQQHRQPLLYLQDSLADSQPQDENCNGNDSMTDSTVNNRTLLERQLLKTQKQQQQQQQQPQSSNTPQSPQQPIQQPSHQVQGATAVDMESAFTTNKQLYVDVGTQIKTFLRSMAIGLAIAHALQQSSNGIQHNTHFLSIYVTCLFVAGCQTILAICVGMRHYMSRNVLFMMELFLDFFCFAIATLIGSIATARCEQDSPVKPCYHAIMRAPLIGCTLVGTMSLFIFTLTLLRK